MQKVVLAWQSLEDLPLWGGGRVKNFKTGPGLLGPLLENSGKQLHSCLEQI